MTVTVTLNNPEEGTSDEVIIENVENRRCFSYVDNERNSCEMCVYDDGIRFFRQCSDHVLELHLCRQKYAKIITDEGIMRIEAKVVDFRENDDILVMRYIIEDVERIIEIRYC